MFYGHGKQVSVIAYTYHIHKGPSQRVCTNSVHPRRQFLPSNPFSPSWSSQKKTSQWYIRHQIIFLTFRPSVHHPLPIPTNPVTCMMMMILIVSFPFLFLFNMTLEGLRFPAKQFSLLLISLCVLVNFSVKFLACVSRLVIPCFSSVVPRMDMRLWCSPNLIWKITSF